MSIDYEPKDIEARWQRRWQEAGTFRVGRHPSRPKYYMLEMLPYPSGRLHMGHVRNYTMGDVVARFKRMRGHDVFYVIGWDSLGLPAENAAIEKGVPPKQWTLANIATMRTQLKALGLSYDWSRETASHDPEYYRWNQWFFLRFLEKDLAYRKKRTLHWCPTCRTVLANEQVEEGACYRCDSAVEARDLEQWFFRTSRFQEDLLSSLDTMTGWPEALRKRQRNWIGRSEGARVVFPVHGRDAELTVFTTRLDTIFGCTFVVIAPDHPVLDALALEPATRARIADFARAVASARVSERGDAEKEGMPTGVSAVNPFTGENVPVWVSNFVVKDYGTGAVMSVPAHDLRDLDFATRYGLPIVPVIRREGEDEPEIGMTDDGVLVLSGRFDAMSSDEARRAMLRHGQDAGFASPATAWRLRDWGLSRQRYWGTPIPIIYCDACGIVPVPDDQLPVILPDDVELTGESSPLARHPAFATTKCPACGGGARRESDTMDTFVDSSWYFLRYLDPHAADVPFRMESVARWMPVDLYIGGPEHAVGHLIYCRWWMRALRAIGFDVPEEPVRRLMHHGMVTLQTQKCAEHGWLYPEQVVDGKCADCGRQADVGEATKMSKSRRNVVEPDAYVQRYGADTMRLFSMFTAPPGQDLLWSADAVEGMHRFIRRVHRMATRDGLAQVERGAGAATPAGERLLDTLHRTIHRVTVDIEERLHFNTSISSIMELLNAIQDFAPVERPLPADSGPVRQAVEGMILLLAPHAPHACEEAWSRLGHATFVSDEEWPSHDPARLIENTVVVAVQVNGKLRGQVELARDASQDEALAAARADGNVARHLAGHSAVKVVHVPNRLLNIVVRPQ